MTLVSRSTVALLLVLSYTTQAFVTPTQIRCQSSLKAAPKRLEENVDGVLYVNDKVRFLLFILQTLVTRHAQHIHSLSLCFSASTAPHVPTLRPTSLNALQRINTT
jgi:hypothetical protein